MNVTVDPVAVQALARKLRQATPPRQTGRYRASIEPEDLEALHGRFRWVVGLSSKTKKGTQR